MLRRFTRPNRAVLIAGAVAFMTSSPAAEQAGGQKPLNEARKREAQTLVELVDRAMALPEATDPGLRWYNDFRKAPDNRVYVPFTVLMPADTAGSIVMYTRVVQGTGAPPPPPEAKPDKPDAKAPAKEDAPEFAFEDLHFVNPSQTAGRLNGAFTVAPGDYTVYVALKPEGATAPAGGAVPVRLIRQQISAPDFWGTELMISGVTLAERIQQLSAPLTAEQQVERPYTVGRTEIIPSFERAFTKKDVLRITFLIYNAQGDGTNKPDVEVEYSFFRKNADSEAYFNKTPPQLLNEKTLPKEFDLKAGHLLVARQDLPLAQFPEGEYRVEVTVRDKRSGKSLQASAPFTLSATATP